ncbi:MAG: ABC transporter permease [Caldisericales bacterium]|nr:ABC transporter permease [Caldisericales bacterium]
MSFIKLAFKGLLRRPAGFIAACLTIAVASFVLVLSLGLSQGYDSALLSNISSIGANILAIPKGCPYEATGVILSGGNLRYAVAENQLEPIRKTDGVKIVSAVIMGQRPVGPYKKVHVIVGADENYHLMRPKLGFQKPFAENEVALGYKISQVLSAKVGDNFDISGKTYKITAIADKGATEDEDLVFVNLKSAQNLLKAEGMLSSILIQVDDPTKSDTVAKKLMTIPDLQVVTIGDFQATISDFISGARIAILSVLVIIILIAAVGILTTQASSVAERKGEIGMMRAMGATGGQVLFGTTLEATILGLIGAITGILSGFVLSSSVSDLIKKSLPQSPGGNIISIGWTSALITLAIVIVISVLAAYGPAKNAASTKPTEAASDE